MANFTSYVQLDARTLDFYKDYDQATFINRKPSSFTVDLPGNFYVNIVGTGFKYDYVDYFGYKYYYPSEGTTTSATLYDGTAKLGVLSNVAITMAQAGQYQSQDALTVSKAILAGADSITGSKFSDYIDGFGGIDKLYGLGGNDTYIVSQAGDKAYEKVGGGTKDLVKASVSYSLVGQDVENLTLTGSSKINGTGNDLANTITSNGATNILTGKGGDDIFVFNTALKSTNIDKIGDFVVADDSIQIAKTIFAKVTAGANNEITSTQFKDITNPKTKLDANDYILYNHDTGALYYDADGSGTTAKVQFATLAPDAAGLHPVLTYHDILVA